MTRCLHAKNGHSALGRVPQCWTGSTSWSRTRCPHSPKRMALDAAQEKSTHPLNERGILCHAKLVTKVHELCCCQRLGQDICNLFICSLVRISAIYNLASITCSNILSFSCTLCYGTLLPAGPRDHCRSHTEAVT